MALRGRSNTSGDMYGRSADSNSSSPSSTQDARHPPGSSASSIRSLRKRTSLFGRSSSDAGRARKFIPLHSATPSQDSTDEQIQTRPRTALSTDQSSLRGRSQPFETIRNSIFGGRRNAPTPSARDRADSSTLAPAAANAVPMWSREHFTNSKDYEHHLTKQTISPPFDFTHVTHTAKAQLPALDTVDERDLPREFWSVSGHQRPKRHLNGIKADDLRQRRQPRETTAISPISGNSRPISPIAEDVFDDRPFIPQSFENMSPLDGHMFDDISPTRFALDDGLPSMQPARQVVKHPKRYSSLNALDVLAQADARASNMNTFYESSSNASEDNGSQTVSPDVNNDQSEFSKPIQKPVELNAVDRSKQPLPPLPSRRPSKNQFRKPVAASAAPKISLIIPVQQPLSPKSKRSSRSPHSTLRSPTFSQKSDVRTSMTFSDWEDDVDFCYQQAAESTCDFNWDGIGPAHGTSVPSTSTGLSVSPYHAYSPAISNGSESSFRFNGANVSSETIAERRRSRAGAAPSQHKRGSSIASVGHRGFLAARKSSSDLTALVDSDSATLQMAQNPPPINILSPVFSVTGADNEAQKSPFVPGAIQLNRFDSVHSSNLSDPESYQDSGSSKHRKSSSYGSHESAARPPRNAAKDTNRWSVASASSVPDLLHPRSKNKVFLSKTIICSPLETLPQSPPLEDEGANRESPTVPRQMEAQPARDNFVMHWPQAAGRPSQRLSLRPEGTQRMSRIIQTPDGLAVPEATKTGPKWI